MKLRIKKRSQAEWLVTYIFALPFAFSFLMDVLYIPSAIKYTIDFALVLLVLIMCMNKKCVEDPHVVGIMRVVTVFILVTIIGFILQYQSIVYYLWGMRNNIRFFVFFMMCTMMMNRESAYSCMNLMDGLFYINVIVSLYQIFILNAHQDRVGGIFGSSRGCNAYTNIYFMIIVAWHMLRYMNNEESLLKLITRCGLSLTIAALAELKMFIFEFAIITVLATTMTKFSVRKLWIIIGAAVGLLVSIQIIKRMFPFFADWFNLDTILEYATSDKGYTYVNDINRLSALAISWNKFLETWTQKLFGLGLGNCDYSSSFSFLTTPFYEKNRHLNYVWFSSSFMILETGLLGLVLYVYFFICVYRAAKTVEKNGTQNIVYCQLARVMALMAPVLIIYNSSLRMECAYMFFFVLALPFVRQPSGE